MRPAARAAARPAVFLDKDGTLLHDRPFNVDPGRMRLAPGAAEGLEALGRLHCPLVVVSNQPGVQEGRFRESELLCVAQRLATLFRACGAHLHAFFYCPHARDARPRCRCRKPAPGLILRAAAVHRLDPLRSWMIGDILDDVEAGRRCGCRTALIDNGNETLWHTGTLREPHLRVPDFAAAARAICADWPRDPELAWTAHRAA